VRRPGRAGGSAREERAGGRAAEGGSGRAPRAQPAQDSDGATRGLAEAAASVDAPAAVNGRRREQPSAAEELKAAGRVRART
jgi:hypothetical protein